MTREEAKTALGDRNNLLWGMSKEEQKYYSEAIDMAISALSADGEYIKKADMEKILYSTNNTVRIGELFTELPTYAIPETTPSGEYIKKADALRIASITTLSVDQVVSTIKALPTYSFSDSAENKGEWIPVEGIEDVPKAGTYWATKHYGDNDYVINLKWYCDCWCDECDRPFYYTELEGITAYMPYMPEPYKKGE